MIRRETRQRQYYGLVVKHHHTTTLRKHFLTMTRARVENVMVQIEKRIQQFKEKNGDTAG
tara:strand:- start:7 stop:186 length:180 start_codon:yes stop_codon:yes gene_type:complete